jgi:hypothetical protein
LYDYYIQKVSASTNFIAYAIKAASKSWKIKKSI